MQLLLAHMRGGCANVLIIILCSLVHPFSLRRCSLPSVGLTATFNIKVDENAVIHMIILFCPRLSCKGDGDSAMKYK